MSRRRTVLGLTGALLMLGGSALAPLPAHAGADGRKNTAIALGAAAAYELLTGKTLAGAALGAGAVYAEKRYEDARRAERDKNNRGYYYQNGGYYQQYGNNQQYGYGRAKDRDYEQGGYAPSRNSNAPGAYYGNSSYGNGWRGQGNGRKQGWRGRSMPPGQWKKQENENGDDNRD